MPAYLTTRLFFTQKETTIIIHLFSFGCYFFPLIGGIISDCYLGRFKTIICFMFIFWIGLLSISATSVYEGSIGTTGAFIGLFLVALGTGGIKPCVSSFGGDQIPADDTYALSIFFSVFYLTVNLGSALSMYITPPLVSNTSCHGRDTCYTIGFTLPAVLIFLAGLFFIFHSPSYVKKEPSGAIFMSVCKSVICAVNNKKKRKKKRFIENASPEYDDLFLFDVEQLLAIIDVLSGLTIFWALYEQQASTWLFQGKRLNGNLEFMGHSFFIYPEQMLVVNTVFVLFLIPFMTAIVYPIIRICGFFTTNLGIMRLGMFMAAISFICTSFVEYLILTEIKEYYNAESNLSLMLQLPQYFFITVGEVMVSVTGLDFAYTHAPDTMKSLCQSSWFLMVAMGNLIVILMNILPLEMIVQYEYRYLSMFLFYTLLMLFSSIVFVLKSLRYEKWRSSKETRYREVEKETLIELYK
eukprot:GHVP01059979.1.p1 GENE.GHVP01059979.1~~GHVP01059979.1.p1  ORF type:complete len:478 (-),score=45.61 GHVP01059979.1:850-2250(-)